MKSGKKMNQVKEILAKSGRDVLMVENCGMPEEHIYHGVEEIPDDYKEFFDETERRRQNVSYHFEEAPSGKIRAEKTFSAPPKKSEGTTFAVGDRVRHKVFGGGTVLSASPMAGDTMLEIAFDTKGTKKLMANFAKLTKE